MPILIADDDPIFLDALAASLRRQGHEVLVARDGAEALAVCRKVRVELIIADWVMPASDGLELCRNVKSDPGLRESYFILLTARGNVPDKVAALDSGADEYVVKPCAEEEILARVRAGLRIRRLQDELGQMEWRLATRELAVSLGHTINNPLTAIANYLELLDRSLREGRHEPTAEMLAGAQREVARIARIIHRMVNLRDPRRVPVTLGGSMTDLAGEP
ncbi:MAG TPA: response regulator [Candidatus Methylomirabilis sp.]|nr:response regulator [Candidatus Methylomirabilis sp.]